jgi:hypothetical protein
MGDDDASGGGASGAAQAEAISAANIPNAPMRAMRER